MDIYDTIIVGGGISGLYAGWLIMRKYPKHRLLILEKERIIILPMESPRKNWDRAFSQMHADNADQLLIDDVFENENMEEWN